jgi:hypothetical protein
MRSAPRLPGALQTAARRQTTPERVTIFTDAQAAIKRTTSEEPGPGQGYATQARKHIAALRRARPASALRSGGAQLTRASRGTRRPTSGPSSRQRSRTHSEWNGYKPERDQCRSPDPSHTSSWRSQKRNGRSPAAGLEGRVAAEKYKLPREQRPDKSVAGARL